MRSKRTQLRSNKKTQTFQKQCEASEPNCEAIKKHKPTKSNAKRANPITKQSKSINLPKAMRSKRTQLRSNQKTQTFQKQSEASALSAVSSLV